MRTLPFARILAGVSLATAFSLSAALAAPHFGLEGGANVGQLGENTFLGNGQYWKWGGGLSVLSRWECAPGWSLEAAPGWERQVRRGTFDIVSDASGTFPIDQSFHFDRLVVPVRVSWRPAVRGFSLEAGGGPVWLAQVERRNEAPFLYTAPALTSGAAGRGPVPDARIFEEVGTLDHSDWTNSFRRWDAMVSGGFGWDQPAGDVTLRVRARWQQGLSDLAKYGDPIHLSSGSFALGFLW